MDITVRPPPVTLMAVTIHAQVPIYAEDHITADFPGRRDLPEKDRVEGDFIGWVDLKFNLDTRKIVGWPMGRREKLSLKPVDSGKYALLDSTGTTVGFRVNTYVPRCLPGEFGDYLGCEIAEDGTVVGWDPCSEEVQAYFIEGQYR